METKLIVHVNLTQVVVLSAYILYIVISAYILYYDNPFSLKFQTYFQESKIIYINKRWEWIIIESLLWTFGSQWRHHTPIYSVFMQIGIDALRVDGAQVCMCALLNQALYIYYTDIIILMSSKFKCLFASSCIQLQSSSSSSSSSWHVYVSVTVTQCV